MLTQREILEKNRKIHNFGATVKFFIYFWGSIKFLIKWWGFHGSKGGNTTPPSLGPGPGTSATYLEPPKAVKIKS